MTNLKARKTLHFVIALIMTLNLFAFSFGTDYVNAAERPVRKTDVTKAASGNQLVLVDGEFIYLSKSTILARLNQIRWEACVNGYPDPRNRSRNLTKADYKEIKWSSDLEWIAQTRAAEATACWGHTRPSGKPWYTANNGGDSSWAENLAMGSNILDGINMWYYEKQDWLDNTPRAVTGHYTSMINPEYNYVGIGAFRHDDGYGAVAGEFSFETNLNETQDGAKGKCSQVMEVKNSSLKASLKTPNPIPIGTSATLKLNAEVMGSRVRLMNVKWSSANPGMVKVNSSGKVAGIYCGTTTVKATAGGKTYSVKVQVYNKPPTGSVIIRNTVANSAKKTNDVIWDKSGVRGATNYEINWKAPGASTWAKRDAGDTIRGTTSGLTIGGLYQIRVRPYKGAVRGAGPAYGSWSPTVYRYFHTTQKIRLKSASKGTFTMSWAKNPAATSYQVMYTTNSNGAGAANNINTVGANATSFTKAGLKSGVTYYVQVREIRKVNGINYIGNISCPVAVKVR